MDLQRRQFHARHRHVLSQSSTQEGVISRRNDNHQIEVIRTGDIPHSEESDRQTDTVDAELSELRVNKPIYSSMTVPSYSGLIHVHLRTSITLLTFGNVFYCESKG